MKDKSRNKKVITHFSAQRPKIAGSTLTQKEKKAIMRELRRKKKEVNQKFYNFLRKLIPENLLQKD